jgi:hypothetical protein
MTTRSRIEIARIFIGKMMDKDWFDICDLNKAMQALDIKPDDKLMDSLKLVHCVHWKQMSDYLKQEIVGLIKQAMGIVEFDAEQEAYALDAAMSLECND